MRVKKFSIAISIILLILGILLFGLNFVSPQFCENSGDYSHFNLCQSAFLILMPLFIPAFFSIVLFLLKCGDILKGPQKISFIVAIMGSLLILSAPDSDYSLFPIDKTRVSVFISGAVLIILLFFTFLKVLEIYRRKK